LTTDSQKEITDKKKELRFCGAAGSTKDTKLDEGASEIGHDLHEKICNSFYFLMTLSVLQLMLNLILISVQS
jgi:hypothetical protein